MGTGGGSHSYQILPIHPSCHCFKSNFMTSQVRVNIVRKVAQFREKLRKVAQDTRSKSYLMLLCKQYELEVLAAIFRHSRSIS